MHKIILGLLFKDGENQIKEMLYAFLAIINYVNVSEVSITNSKYAGILLLSYEEKSTAKVTEVVF